MDAFDVLGEPRRRRLVELLWAGERTVGQLHAAMPEVSMAAVSQHLKRLREAGVVEVTRDGRFRRYRVDREALGPLAAALDTMWSNRLDRLAAIAESLPG